MTSSGQAVRTAGNVEGILLLASVALSTMGIVVLAPILPAMQAHFAAVPGAATLVPLVMTIPALCAAFLSPLAGYLCDRFGRKVVLCIAMATYAPLGMAPLLLDNLWLILLSRIGVGVVEAMIMTASTALIGDFFHGRDRDRWLAGQVGIASIAAIGFLLVSGALGTSGWRHPFLLYVLPLLLFALLSWRLWEPARLVHDAQETSGQAWLARMMPIYAITLFGGALFTIIPVQIGFILAKLGVTATKSIGAASALAAAAVPIGSALYWRLSGRRIAHVLGFAFGLAAASLAGIAMVKSIPIVLIASVGNQIGAGIILPCLATVALARVPAAARGRGIGLWQSAFSVGQGLSPVFFGVTSTALGLSGGLSVFAGICACVAGGMTMSRRLRLRR